MHSVWDYYARALEKKVAQGEMESFLQWREILQTCFMSNPGIAAQRLRWLHMHARAEVMQAAQETKVGQPVMYNANYSGSTITHAFHWMRFENATGSKLERFEGVYEFGGGYGAMCRLIRRMRFAGSYVIQDIPVMRQIQDYYLQACGLQPVQEVRELHNYLFIATSSLNEVPAALREEVYPVIADAAAVLIAYNEDSLPDAKEWFEKLMQRTDHEWKRERVDANRAGLFYAFGIR